MNAKKLLAKLSNSQTNVRFGDLVKLARAVGFQKKGGDGSHEVYAHPAVKEILNLQRDGGQAKPYQVRQLLKYIEEYNLTIDGD
jgi:hypothetical protein